MKFIYILMITFILTILGSCQSRSSDTIYMQMTGYGDWSETYKPANKHEYYLDADAPDGGDGLTPATAWNTIARVQSQMLSGDTIHVYAGNYGDFTETGVSDRTDWITFIAEESGVIFGKVNIDYKSLSNAYIRFDGITFMITPDNSRSTFETGLSFRDLSFVEVRNCEIFNTHSKYMLDNGIRITDSSNVLIYHNHLHTMITSIVSYHSRNITVSKNHIHELAEGSGLIYDAESSNAIIEMNNIYDSNESASDPDYTTAVHSNSLMIKSCDILIRKNVLHGIGSSHGLAIQSPNDDSDTSTPRSNIIFENNLVYDPHNTTFEIQNAGENIIIRNNTFIGRLRATTNPAARLYVALRVRNMADGYDGSGLHIYNNIVAGEAIIPGTATIINNIFWSFYYSGDNWNYQSTIANNTVVTSAVTGAIPDYFINGFFNGIISFDDFTPEHNLYKDFTLAPTSPAINAGHAVYCPGDSLGSIDGAAGSGFITDNGKKRSADLHSAGCYE